MKKTIITALAIAGFAMGALAQGSISGLNNSGQYVTTGLGQTDPNSSANWYTGGLTLEVFFSSTATSGNANTINALMGTSGGGAAALSQLAGYGFSAVSLTGDVNSSVGFVSGAANGNNNFTSFPGTVDLSTAFTPSTVGYLAFYVVGAGAYSSYSALEVIAGNYGGQQVTQTYGTPFSTTAPLTSLGGTYNLDLTSVPEPSSLALAGLGGFGMLMAMRRKKA
jgi:hypothetical protein